MTRSFDMGVGISRGLPVQQNAGGLLPNPSGIVFDGDSITQGATDNTAPFPAQFATNSGQSISNVGVSGAWLGDRDSAYPADVAPLYNAGSRNTLHILAGVNELRGGQTDLSLRSAIQSYCVKARSTGFRVIIGTLIPTGEAGWTPTQEGYRVAYNAWLRTSYATFADGLVDYDGIVQLSPPTTDAYYQDDLLHPTNRAARLMAELLRTRFGLTNLGDTVPGAFAFTDITGATPSTDCISEPVAITGFTAASAISVTGGSYSVNGGAFTASAGTINPHDEVRITLTSASAASTATSAVLTVGGASDTFSVTTATETAFSTTPINGSWTFSNGNHTVSEGGSAIGTVITDTAIVGKKAFAARVVTKNGDFAGIGVHDGSTTSDFIGDDAHGYGYWSNSNFIPGFVGGFDWPADGSAIGVVVDATAKKMWLTKDGLAYFDGTTFRSPADVAAGTGGYSIGGIGTIYGAVGSTASGGKVWTLLAAYPWALPGGYSLL